MQSAKFNIGLTMAYSVIEEMSELSDYLNQNRGASFSEGEGANQINLIFHDQRALGDGENETLDFHDGSLTNKVSQAITMDKFKGLYIKNNSTDSTLILGNAGVNDLALFGAAAHTLVLQPLSEITLLFPDADGVDCTTNAKLKITHGGEGSSAPKYDIIAVGVDAA